MASVSRRTVLAPMPGGRQEDPDGDPQNVGYQPYSDFVPPRPSHDRSYEVQHFPHHKEMKEWVENQRRKASKARRPNNPGVYQKKKKSGFKKPWKTFLRPQKPKKWSNTLRKQGTKPPRPRPSYEEIFNTSPSPNLEPPPPPQITSSVPFRTTSSPFDENPSYSAGNSSYSNVYFETPSLIDKMDDHIEVYELTISPDDEFEDNNKGNDRSDSNHEILKDYYLGEDNLSRVPSRRPNSYFYDEASDGEMKESVNKIRRATTTLPSIEDPLPTYKSYTEQKSTTTTPTPQPSTTQPSEYIVYPATFTPKSKFQSAKSSPKKKFTTNRPLIKQGSTTRIPSFRATTRPYKTSQTNSFRSSTTNSEYRDYPATFTPKSKFQSAKSLSKFTTIRPLNKQGSTTNTPPFTPTTRPYRKSSKNSFRSSTTNSPVQDPIHHVTTSYDSPLIPIKSPTLHSDHKYDPNIFEENNPEDTKNIATPKYQSKIFQQIGNQVSVNITTPSEKSWAQVVTMKPNLRRDGDTFVDSTPTSISTTQHPPSHFVSTPSWIRQKEVTTSANVQAKQEEESQPSKKSFTLTPKVKPLLGFLSTPIRKSTPTTNLSTNSGIQWGTYKPKKERDDKTNLSGKRNWQKRKPYTKKRKAVTLKPRWSKRKTTLTPHTFVNDAFKTTRNPALKKSAQTLKNRIRSTYSPRKHSTTMTSTKAPNLDIGKALDKIISTSTFISTAKPRSYVSSTNNIWTATKKPPPPKVTTPGWHIHTNADITTPSIKRSDNLPTEHISPVSPVPSYKNNISTLFPRRPSKKARNNIFQKIKQLSRKNAGKLTSKPNVKIYKFTADEALEKKPLKKNKYNFESQKLERDPQAVERDIQAADSRSHITVTKYTPENTRNTVNKFSSQVSDWTPLKSGRRSDDDSLASLKITPDIVLGGYRISRLKRIAGPWLLRSPDGTQFRFNSLQQIYDLNQNNFVPG